MKSKNTKPEIIVQKLLNKLGIYFKCHEKKLPGTPDIVIETKKVILNVKGCFWHFHGCSDSNLPKNKTNFWLDKLQQNKNRDFQNTLDLQMIGWKVLDIWECSLKKNSLQKTSDIIERFTSLD